MASGACVVRREGKRGATWSIKFRDAAGRQVWERLGREPQWNERRAERELGKRLQAVERDRWAKPTEERFEQFAERWLTEYLPGRQLKKSTVIDYTGTVRNHAIPAFGSTPLGRVTVAEIDRYIAGKIRSGLKPKTVTNHVRTLHLVFDTARRWKLISVNPVDDATLPKMQEPETVILQESEIAALFEAYTLLALDEDGEMWALVRRMVIVALGTGMRRGEIFGLPWRHTDLLERHVHVRQQWTRNEMTSPKSKASRRTIGFGGAVAAAIEEQWQTTRYRGDDDLVFGHPALGAPLDPSKITRSYVKPALAKAGIDKAGFMPWHGQRHTALTTDAAVGNPNAYVQAKAGHSSFSITERYIHAAQTAFPGAVERSEERMFGSTEVKPAALRGDKETGGGTWLSR